MLVRLLIARLLRRRLLELCPLLGLGLLRC